MFPKPGVRGSSPLLDANYFNHLMWSSGNNRRTKPDMTGRRATSDRTWRRVRGRASRRSDDPIRVVAMVFRRLARLVASRDHQGRCDHSFPRAEVRRRPTSGPSGATLVQGDVREYLNAVWHRIGLTADAPRSRQAMTLRSVQCRAPWANGISSRYFPRGSARAGPAYVNPHSLRNTLVQFACYQKLDAEPLSPNLGLASYLPHVFELRDHSVHCQAEVLSRLAADDALEDDAGLQAETLRRVAALQRSRVND